MQGVQGRAGQLTQEGLTTYIQKHLHYTVCCWRQVVGLGEGAFARTRQVHGLPRCMPALDSPALSREAWDGVALFLRQDQVVRLVPGTGAYART